MVDVVDTPIIVVLIDGFDPEYLGACPVPNLAAMAQRGFRVEGRGMTPSVTNVNNVSLVTGSYPEQHGITSNYLLDRQRGEEFYMESGEYLRAETMFQRAAACGLRSLLVTAKDKLRSLLSDGVTVSISSENPPGWLVSGIGEPPPIYSLEVNRWVLDAGRYAMSREPFDLVYLTTTDYAMHTYGPDHPESARHVRLLDEGLGAVLEQAPGARMLVTADHGMSDKSRMLHLPAELARYGIGARAVPVIKDRYVVHHSNLGGSIYVHLDDSTDLNAALDTLQNLDGVEAAVPGEEAASQFRLMPERIGDILVLADPTTVFGDPSEVAMPEGLRSHGSAHETTVPIFGCGPGLDNNAAARFRENLDVGRYVFEDVLPQRPDGNRT
jgi:phosphonoacetate hydrolase